MLVGDPTVRTQAAAQKYRQVTYTCLSTLGSRSNETKFLPDRPCKEGIMANVRFPT
jgi:hypothetical protein